MVKIVKADVNHVGGICDVCAKGQWATYGDIYSKEYIERIIKEYYEPERVTKEVTETSKEWGGYFVAVENGQVIGAGGGGLTSDTVGELYVLYMDPDRRNEGVGTRLLKAITEQQKQLGAKEQWLSVQKGNTKGIPFYEAKGFQFKHEQKGYGNREEEDYISLRYYRTI